MRHLLLIPLLLSFTLAVAQNKPQNEEWLQDAGFGMFVHWSLDAQLGTVISHSLVGASTDYVERFYNDLPKTFNPTDYDPERMAVLAKMAGMKYMVFTTKHHAGFCLWDTKTTDFNIMNTPYNKDIVKEYVDACRKHGLKVGLYFSPEDFLFLHQNNEPIKRRDKDKISEELKEKYITYVKAQCKELLTMYGDIDIMFFDGKKNFLIDALKPYVWNLNPNLLITRGEIETPEQHLLSVESSRVWESCMTMGTQWQFKPTNEAYKPASQVIRILTETRAKGGALLLNIGPDAYGKIPFEQDRNLREVATWYFINHEAVDNVRPWIVSNEHNIWYTKAKDKNTVYAILFGNEGWPRGDRKEYLLKSVKATKETRISVLGQNDSIVEYLPETNPISRYEQTDEGLRISIVRAQRIYNNHKWHNAIVVKLENVEEGLEPPAITTNEEYRKSPEGITCEGELLSLGDAKEVKVAFLYRKKSTKLNEITGDGGWVSSIETPLSEKGRFEVTLPQLDEVVYEYRAIVIHPKITMYGEIFEIKPE